jgi:hypothetical protein
MSGRIFLDFICKIGVNIRRAPGCEVVTSHVWLVLLQVSQGNKCNWNFQARIGVAGHEPIATSHKA